MIMENTLKKELKEGKNAVGTFIRINDPAIVEVIGMAGFDFIVIDNEHTAMSKESMINLIRAAELSGVTAVVRVRENSAAEILQALDAGALGVQVPQVDTYEEARAIVDRVKYAPIGARGFASSQRSAGYGNLGAKEYSEISNRNTMIVSYCETLKGYENLDEILKIDELDVIFIGPNDLSQAFGVIGESNHPKVLEAIDVIISKVRKAGKAVGIIAGNAEQAKMWFDKGAQFIALSSDLGMVSTLGKEYTSKLK